MSVGDEEAEIVDIPALQVSLGNEEVSLGEGVGLAAHHQGLARQLFQDYQLLSLEVRRERSCLSDSPSYSLCLCSFRKLASTFCPGTIGEVGTMTPATHTVVGGFGEVASSVRDVGFNSGGVSAIRTAVSGWHV